jgi:CDP-diacylglycerol pyrophosphatase
MFRRCVGLFGVAALLIGFSAYLAASATNREALWKIVHDGCVPHWALEHDPSPCVKVDVSGGDGRGIAILKDRVGKAQFLAIPTARISGIESPELQGPEASNLFGAAWHARQFLFAKIGKTLARDGIGLAINSAARRSQDQAHIHIDCIRPDVRAILLERSREIRKEWSDDSLVIDRTPYSARRIDGLDLTGVNPFELVANRLKSREEEMGRATIVVIGVGSEESNPGFILLVSLADSGHGAGGHGEDLLDHECRLAGAD